MMFLRNVHPDEANFIHTTTHQHERRYARRIR